MEAISTSGEKRVQHFVDLVASIRDSARDGRPRKWPAGKACTAVRSGMAECTPNLRAA